MKTTRSFRFLFASLLAAVAWIVLSSYALAYGIYTSGTTGNDISYPQCSTSTYPNNSFGIVGVTGGKAFTDNSCLSQEFAWANALSTPRLDQRLQKA
jgi:non-ribosomal peptide synthetase component F